MEKLRVIEMIKNNFNIIVIIDNLIDEMKLLVIKENGFVLEYINNLIREM